jgi:uncharacterized damage-inducible protein DinB
MTDEPKATLKRYLQASRDALLWKLDGLSERDLRMPRTPTGTNLAGIVKHCANVEVGYFGSTFGRAWPDPADPCYVALEVYDDDPQADWYLRAEDSVADLVDFYRRVWAFADATIDELPLDAVGSPPWWPAGSEVTLHHMLVRVVDDLARHAGQADVLRESIDGSAGLNRTNSSLPDDEQIDWRAYVAKLDSIARSHSEATVSTLPPEA